MQTLEMTDLLLTTICNILCGNDFVLSSQMRLPQDSYTYINEAHHTTSGLDHCFSSEDAHATIQKVDIKYNYGTTDHIPVVVTINIESLPKVTKNTNDPGSFKLDWSQLKQADIDSYCSNTGESY